MPDDDDFKTPKTYPELQDRYGAYIQKLLVARSEDRIGLNIGEVLGLEHPFRFDHMHSYVWVRLLECNLLERFNEYVKAFKPKVLTAKQVCAALGMFWSEWVSAWQSDTLMPTPINIDEFRSKELSWYDAPTALFSYRDVVGLALSMGREFKHPEVHVTEPFFREYLSRAVHNAYANYVRMLNKKRA